jgi:hypothetical protein
MREKPLTPVYDATHAGLRSGPLPAESCKSKPFEGSPRMSGTVEKQKRTKDDFCLDIRTRAELNRTKGD